MGQHETDRHLEDWNARETLAEQILPLANTLFREHGLSVFICGISIVQKTPIEIIKAHRYVRKLWGKELPLETTCAVLRQVTAMDPGPARLDVGKLVGRFWESGESDLEAYTAAQLADLAGKREENDQKPQDVVLYGFGRIGRLMARILIDRVGGGAECRLRAIVVRPGPKDDLEKRANLLRFDSVHGHFDGTVEVLDDGEQRGLVINGNVVHVIYSNAPEEVDYSAHGIEDAIVIDNTGIWRDREALGRHLQAKGAAKVILTAPGKGDVPNIVYGVNHYDLDPNENVLSAASCTTNAIVPVLKVVNDEYGIEGGHMETIHAYTNDQNLIDNFHKKARRGRAAALNMVITETGAAKAVAKALPELAGKLTGNAIRVPTPNVSLAILNLTLGREVTTEEINEMLRRVSMDSPLQRQIDISLNTDVVSSDLVGNRHAAIVDVAATLTHGKRVTLYTWYDNEYGYSRQVMRLLQRVGGKRAPHYPAG